MRLNRENPRTWPQASDWEIASLLQYAIFKGRKQTSLLTVLLRDVSTHAGWEWVSLRAALDPETTFPGASRFQPKSPPLQQAEACLRGAREDPELHPAGRTPRKHSHRPGPSLNFRSRTPGGVGGGGQGTAGCRLWRRGITHADSSWNLVALSLSPPPVSPAPGAGLEFG